LQALDPTLPVIVMTAWGSVDKAVEAMRLGARDFIEKPWDNARLLTTIRNQVEWSRAIRAGQRLAIENEVLRRDQRPVLIAESAVMKRVIALMERVAPSDATVLITGEHGTGKEVAARWIHAASTRKDRPLVIVNAGGLPEGVFESELFGHVKGAFTDARADRVGRFEMADGGTLFLDEIANLSLSQQARLLRVLQNGELERVGDSRTRKVESGAGQPTNADPPRRGGGRTIPRQIYSSGSTHRDPPAPAAISGPRISRPAGASISWNATREVPAHARALRRPPLAVLLGTAPWPGNVRELDHSIERATLLAQGPLIDVADLGRGDSAPEITSDRGRTLEDVERDAIRAALAAHGGNVLHAPRHWASPGARSTAASNGTGCSPRAGAARSPHLLSGHGRRSAGRSRCGMGHLENGVAAAGSDSSPAGCCSDHGSAVPSRRGGAWSTDAHARRTCSPAFARATSRFALAAPTRAIPWARSFLEYNELGEALLAQHVSALERPRCCAASWRRSTSPSSRSTPRSGCSW
jgi:hypothetical protein